MTETGLDLCVEEYLASIRIEAGLSPNTVAAYRRDLVQYLSFLEGREPGRAEVEAFAADLTARGLAESTHKRKLAAVRGLHRFAVAEGLRETDPTVLVQTPSRPPPLPKALDIEEVSALIESPDLMTVAGRRDRALLEFLYASGARISETLDLDLTDLDLHESSALVTGKGRRQRVVPLGSHAVAALEHWLADRLSLVRRSQRGDPVFVSLRGTRLSRQAGYEIVRKYAVRAGIDASRVSPHVLRHSAATHMVEAGADLRTVQEMLGHATISTTQVYTKVTTTHLMEVYREAHPRSH